MNGATLDTVATPARIELPPEPVTAAIEDDEDGPSWVAVPLTDLIAEPLVDGNMLCPFHDDHTPSLHIYPDHYRCYVCGAHGNQLDWLMLVEGMDRRTALNTLETWDGPRQIQAPDDGEAKRAFALQLWEQAQPITGTLAARYLSDIRKIDLAALPASIDEALRFHPRCPFGPGAHHPCLLALMRNPTTDVVTGIQRIGLTSDARKIDRRMLGRRGAVKLWPAESQLVIGEGLETVLAAATRVPYQDAPLQPAWAALSSDALGQFPVLPKVERLIVLVDHDPAGKTAASYCTGRWERAKRSVIQLTPDQPGFRLQRPHSGGVSDMPKTTFTATTSASNPTSNKVTVDDFVAYLPKHLYIFTPCREIWVGSGVDGCLPKMQVFTKSGKPRRNKDGDLVYELATKWLDRERGINQATWCPGQPMLIEDRIVVDGGWIEKKGATTFNWYRPPRIELGDASKAGPWIEHVHKVLHAGNDADHCIKWFAHRVQRPAEKINHGLVIGGAQGIGKDSMLEPVKHAVGPWNFHDVSPTHLLANFNSFARSVILRVNEGRDLGEVDRFKFYDRTKIYTAAPPDVLRVNEKFIQEFYVFNVLGFILTTNHKTDGIYLPADDRRHYVAWSDREKEDFTPAYWNELWSFYGGGGLEHVAAYLTELDISGFDPKAPPPKTPAFWNIVSVGVAPEDAELADVIDKLKNPDALTIIDVIAAAEGETAVWLMNRGNRRSLPHRLERCGYVLTRNPDAKSGLWRLKGGRQIIYVKASLTLQERETAAREYREAHQ